MSTGECGPGRRRSIRLPTYDYASPGTYFVTICTHRRTCVLSNVVDADVRLTGLGRLADDAWNAIPSHFPRIELDAHVVMPNHVHGIIRILGGPSWDRSPNQCPPVGAAYTPPRGPDDSSSPPPCPTLATIVASFKGAVTRAAHLQRRWRHRPIWQRNYYEHVIRNDAALNRIRAYVAANPANWTSDGLHPARDAAIGRPSPQGRARRDGGAAYTPPLQAMGASGDADRSKDAT